MYIALAFYRFLKAGNRPTIQIIRVTYKLYRRVRPMQGIFKAFAKQFKPQLLSGIAPAAIAGGNGGVLRVCEYGGGGV